jgi:hypothetical protein
MRTKTLICILCLGTAGIGQQASAPPGQQPSSPPAGAPQGFAGFARGGQPFNYADNEGWLSLFDGETLKGWDGDTRFWSVKDGSIYVEPTCEKPTGTIYLVWQGAMPPTSC